MLDSLEQRRYVHGEFAQRIDQRLRQSALEHLIQETSHVVPLQGFNKLRHAGEESDAGKPLRAERPATPRSEGAFDRLFEMIIYYEGGKSNQIVSRIRTTCT